MKPSIFLLDPYLISEILISGFLALFGLFILASYRRNLGKWSIIMVIIILSINLMQVYFATVLIQTDRYCSQWLENTWETLTQKFYFDQFNLGFVIFVVNIVIVKLHFIQLIFQSNSTEECDKIMIKVNKRVKLISVLSLIFIGTAAVVTFIVKTKLDDDFNCKKIEGTNGRECWISTPMRYTVTFFGLIYFVLYTFILYFFIKAGYNLIPQYFSDSNQIIKSGSYCLLGIISFVLFIITLNTTFFMNGSIPFYHAIWEAKDGKQEYVKLVDFLHVNGDIAYFITATFLLILF